MLLFNLQGVLAKETGNLGHQDVEFGAKKRRVREQEGRGDQAPLLDFGHLECQSCELSVSVLVLVSNAKHKARSRRAVPNYAESALLLPFPSREEWTFCPGYSVTTPGDKEATNLRGCESVREVSLWSP